MQYPPCVPFITPEYPTLCDVVTGDDWLPFINAASDWLYHRSGHTVGECRSEYWPCLPTCRPSCEECGCLPERRIYLPTTPVRNVTVTIDDVPSLEFRVDVIATGAILVLLGDGWPSCQNWEHGVKVSYDWGNPPRDLDQLAAAAIASELARLVECPDTCSLPANAVSVSREGIGYELETSTNWGFESLPTVKEWLQARNPNKIQGSLIIGTRQRQDHARYEVGV